MHITSCRAPGGTTEVHNRSAEERAGWRWTCPSWSPTRTTTRPRTPSTLVRATPPADAGRLARRDSGVWTHWAPAGSPFPTGLEGARRPARWPTRSRCWPWWRRRVWSRRAVQAPGRPPHLPAAARQARNRVQAGKFCALYPPTEQCALQILRRLAASCPGSAGRTSSPTAGSAQASASPTATGRSAAGAGSTPRAPGTDHDRPDGREIDDERAPRFQLPAGVADPFRAETAVTPAQGRGHRCAATPSRRCCSTAMPAAPTGSAPSRASRSSSRRPGPTTATPRTARTPKSRLNAEYLTLRAISSRGRACARGRWSCSSIGSTATSITEWVAGNSLYHWMVANNPALHLEPTAAAFAEYYRRCLALLDQLDAQLRRLHELGYVFVDLSPNNVLVDDDDRVRLVDFEAVQPIPARPADHGHSRLPASGTASGGRARPAGTRPVRPGRPGAAAAVPGARGGRTAPAGRWTTCTPT